MNTFAIIILVALVLEFSLELAVKDKRQAWKVQKAKIERQVKALEEQVSRLQQKRRQYSWQQAEGIITNEELRTAHKQLKSEEGIIDEQLGRIAQFRGEPAPPDMATFKKLAEYWTWEIAGELDDAPDDVRARFTELFDLYATIRPDSSRGGYHFDLVANIPLEMEGDKPGAYDMVFRSSGCLYTHEYSWAIPFSFKLNRLEISSVL